MLYYYIILYYIMLYYIYYIVLFYFILYYIIILYYITLYYFNLFYIILYYFIILYYIIIYYYIILFYIILYYILYNINVNIYIYTCGSKYLLRRYSVPGSIGHTTPRSAGMRPWTRSPKARRQLHWFELNTFAICLMGIFYGYLYNGDFIWFIVGYSIYS